LAQLKTFWIRRALRIFPLYYGFLLLLFIAYLISHIPATLTADLPALLTYCFNFRIMSPNYQFSSWYDHCWSLSVEEQFYLLFPFIVLRCRRAQLKIILLLIIIGAACFRAGWGQSLLSTHNDYNAAMRVYWHTFSHTDAFALGGLITVFNLPAKLARYTSLIFIAALLLALAAGFLQYYRLAAHETDILQYLRTMGYPLATTASAQQVWGYTLLNAGFASLLLLLVAAPVRSVPRLLYRIFSNQFLVQIGKVSYGMYLLHRPLQELLVRFTGTQPAANLSSAALFLLFAAVVYALAAVSYHWYEKPFLQLKERWS
jgi:peptidoglycan/LPS O-acetylase OafA/YrhL